MTTTANTHTVERRVVPLGMGLNTVRFLVKDNLGVVVHFASSQLEAEQLAKSLSEPKPDE